ncbi:hypothetical protein IWW56_001085 [Coemansia sp. RSA 2131]|nr:hypothetical protein IWW56_001085 [Coemansia sp. RSA 2131]
MVHDSFIYSSELPNVAYDTSHEGSSKYEHEADGKPSHDMYDKPKYEHDSYDTSKCEHYTYDKPKHDHGTYDEPKHRHDTDDKPKYEQNAEHDTYDKPKYDDSEYQPPVSDKKHVPALHIGPDPLDQMAPYLVPPSNSPAYHSYHSAIRKQAVLDGIAAELKDAKVIPDILPATFIPEFELSITFNGLHHPIDMGQLLSINNTEAEPIIEFDAPRAVCLPLP